jgi:enoyl-CoA hydratase
MFSGFMRYDEASIQVWHMASDGNITLERDADGIARVTIRRSAKLNALNRAVITELDRVQTDVEKDEYMRGVLLTGEGEKAFAAGADIAELAEATPMQAAEISAFGQRVFRRIELSPKPWIAAIQGFALGGGLELALCCALRVAADNAKFGQPELKLGVITGYGGSQRLPRLVGRGRALELLLTGNTIDAQEAWRIGLVNSVVPGAEVLERARALLLCIARNAPAAVALMQHAVDAAFQAPLEDGLRSETIAFGLAAGTADYREGMRAFLEKRPPNFTGK